MTYIKRLAIVLGLLMVTLIPFNVSVHASETDTLVIHYFRFDANYQRWDSVWLWPNQPVSGEGNRYMWNDEDSFGKVLRLDLNETNMADSTRIGVIVRDNDWAKDVEQDRFIDLSNPNAQGEVHVWLVQNDPEIYYSLEDADVSHQILNATFADEEQINFRATTTVSADDVTLLADDVEVPFSHFNMSQWDGSLRVLEPVDLTKTYELLIDFGDETPARVRVGFDGFYTSDAFNEAFGYDGDLGALYSETSTEFKLWAPISEAVQLNLYSVGHYAHQEDYQGNPGTDDPYATYAMVRQDKGVWSITVEGDLDRHYYTFTVTNGGVSHEVVDPYAFSAGVNGQRGMVVNFERHNPENWTYGTRPDTMMNYTDAVIWELHVRDLTSHESWTGTEDYRGKFLGLVERGTTWEGVKTGFDHILELGVTHVQLIPVNDHGIIDETRLNDPSYFGIHDGIFNWGYMPHLFNTLEGSYATDPFNGEVRITEFKEMMQGFHDHDIRVIMDVVYNHTGRSADSNFDLILPGYYFRMNPDGSFSNGSGTGNETASERYMFRKFMVDSLLFWVNEYNIDGFRFDLMKLHDVTTMNMIAEELHKIDPTIIIFGEPWTGGASPLPSSEAAYNANLDRMPYIGVFNDDTRDGIKGSVFSAHEGGFVQGNNFTNARVMLGIAGGTAQPGISLGALPKGAWAMSPIQTVNYVSAHDNNTLHDKLVLSTFESMDVLTRMQRQANAIVLTSQGVAFLHAGVEMMRTKPCVVPESGEFTCDSGNRFDHNSYRSPDEVNQLDWNWKVEHYDTFVYYRNMIELRKMKPVFRLATAQEVSDHLTFIPQTSGLISYMLDDPNDEWKSTLVIHNNGSREREMQLPLGTWHVVATTDEIGDLTTSHYNGAEVPTLETLYIQEGGDYITLAPNDTLIMYSLELIDLQNAFPDDDDDADDDTPIDDGDSAGCFGLSFNATPNYLILILPGLGLMALIGTSIVKRNA